MQLLKLKIISKLLELEKDLGSEVIEELPGDPYRYILEEMPKINFNRYEVEKLITGEIYAVMKAFMERLYTNGELYNFDMIRLTGQSCKIGLFRDALKEFVPGNMMQSGGSVKKEELKLACVDGLMRYLYDKRTGYAGFDIRDEEALIPYKIKALSYSGRQEVLIDGFESNKMTGSLLRSLEDILLRMYLYDASENVRFEHLFHFKKEQNPDYMVGHQDIGE